MVAIGAQQFETFDEGRKPKQSILLYTPGRKHVAEQLCVNELSAVCDQRRRPVDFVPSSWQHAEPLVEKHWQ